MKAVFRIILYAAAVFAIALAVLDVVSIATRRSIGFTHETWHTPANVGYHANRGMVMNFGLLIFIESEQHPVGAQSVMWWPAESDRWDSAGSPPQFTVSGTTIVRDLTASRTGYVYSERRAPDWQGQYHLIAVHPFVLLPACGLIFALAIWNLVATVRKRSRKRKAAPAEVV